MAIKNPMVETLLAVFGEPRSPDPENFLRTYVNALKGPGPVLDAAAQIILRSHRVSTWPTIGECLDAIELAGKQSKAGGVGLQPIDNWDDWYGGLVAQVSHASGQAEIDAAVAKVEPYERAQWCMPGRVAFLREAGKKRLASLAKGGQITSPRSAGQSAGYTDRMLGEGDE